MSRLEADEGATQRRDDYVALKDKEKFEQTRSKEPGKVEKVGAKRHAGLVIISWKHPC